MSELRLGFPGSEVNKTADVPAGSPPPWDLNSDLKVVGKDHPRLDGRAKVTGQAKYTYDIQFPDMVYAKFLRSPFASAKVTKLDLSKAEAMKGVVDARAFEGEVRYAGQQVAGVAAVSEEILRDALAAIEVEYEQLEHVVTVEDAMADGAPSVKRGPNVTQDPRSRPKPAHKEKVEAAHASADVVLEREYRTQVQTHSCLETHGTVCKWEGDHLMVWASTQATFAFKMTMARSLRIQQNDVTVITEHMGGGFGSKFGADMWDVYCAAVAHKTKRPCRYMLDRREEHLAGNRPDSIQKCKFSVKKDGTLLGAQVEAYGTAGLGRGAGVTNPTIYEFQATYSDQKDVFTHASGARAFRAPRHPQGVFALEGMLDELAEAIEMDPLELRKKNDSHPVRRAQYDVGAKEIGWSRRKKSGSDEGPIKRGFGMASARWKHNGRPGCQVACRIGKDGHVLMRSGAQDIGTGTRTVIAIMAAEELGLKPSQVEVKIGNTNDPFGHASGGSVTAPSIGPVARHAAWQAKQDLLEQAAAALGCEANALDLKEGKLVGGPKELTFAKVCQLMGDSDAIEKTGQGPREFFKLPKFAGEVAGVQFAEVEVDTELGTVRVKKVVAVQDCGLVADPLLARSQINGAVIQGISYALFENRLLDPTNGSQVNSGFLDYKIMGAVDMPEIVSIPFSVANGMTATGMSSLGEPPAVPTAGAIANAVANAIGARVRSLPITPDKVLAALGGAK